MLRPTNTTGYIAFNYKVKEFQDKRVRQAIAYAINARRSSTRSTAGTGLAATQFQPPPLWGYNKDLKGYEYSPAKAQDLLKQAGLPERLQRASPGRTARRSRWSSGTCRARGPYFPSPKEIGEAMAADLAKVGIKAQLQTVEWAKYLDKREERRDARSTCWVDRRQRRSRQLPLLLLLLAKCVAARAFYANQPLSDVLKRAQKLTNQSERAKLYRQAEQMLHDDVARLFIANNRAAAGLRQEGEGLRHATRPATEYFNTVELQ